MSHVSALEVSPDIGSEVFMAALSSDETPEGKTRDEPAELSMSEELLLEVPSDHKEASPELTVTENEGGPPIVAAQNEEEVVREEAIVVPSVESAAGVDLPIREGTACSTEREDATEEQIGSPIAATKKEEELVREEPIEAVVGLPGDEMSIDSPVPDESAVVINLRTQ
jgi:hypothetical protein